MLLEVNDRFSGYAKCNVGQNGSDGHGNSCTDDTYCCFCQPPGNPSAPGGPCNSTVGRQDLYDHFGPGNTPRTAALMASAGPPDHHSWCASAHSSVADCYRAHSVQKLTKQNPGYWYSSLAKGYCGDADSAGDCTWRVVAVEKVCRTPVGNAAAPALQNSRTAPAFPTPAWISSAACC